MWKDAWFLSKRDLSGAMIHIAPYFLINCFAFIILASTFITEKEGVLERPLTWITTVFLLSLITFPYYTKRHHASYRLVGSDLSRREIAFFRTFSIHPNAIVYSRLLSILLVGCIYLMILVPITYIGLKNYYPFSETHITSMILLSLAISILLITVLLITEIVLPYKTFFWSSLIIYLIPLFTLIILQYKYNQHLIQLLATGASSLTNTGCVTLFFASLVILYFATQSMIQYVRLK
ncbi:hypothetical protein [Thermoactinomyces sp. DSM 45892]|uniref:hypothetical protein n=1 Tax=Thermoactinomyces sp. DSM 45892 TaxID=1882753 RepID=UPI000894AAF9|nr:hypothetical protein [Thermoactinomyces sp. DSM 45892]SDY93042.1 hypothetical protein SAMN05444416_11052 [Thermoactinomyces sp. DSM 45892]